MWLERHRYYACAGLILKTALLHMCKSNIKSRLKKSKSLLIKIFFSSFILLFVCGFRYFALYQKKKDFNFQVQNSRRSWNQSLIRFGNPSIYSLHICINISALALANSVVQICLFYSFNSFEMNCFDLIESSNHD